MLGLELGEKDRNLLKIQNEEWKYPLMLNIATCFYQQKQYEKAL